jgi:hypothetical protein
MRAYVLSDAALAAKLAGRSVRLDVDTEKPSSAAFVERFPIDAWPTLLVIDPATERVVMRWAGTATKEQVLRLAEEGAAAMQARQRSEADAALARADRLVAERRHAEASAAFREALAAGGPRWAGRARAAEARVQALAFTDDAAGCARAAAEAAPALAPTSRARVLAQGLACAGSVDEGAPRTAALDALEPAARKTLDAPGLLADDRSSLYEGLVGARDARGDEAGGTAVARRWLAFLDAEAARAGTPLARSAFDGPRLAAARRLGRPALVIPALEASARALPEEFAPTATLAAAYLAADRPRDAVAAADRALARAEGPRRVRVLTVKARAQRAIGDAAAARETVAQAIAAGEALPEALRPRSALADARALAHELGARGAPAE